MESGEFYIAIYSRKKMSIARHLVKGWVDKENMVGYHENENGYWFATALESGRSIFTKGNDIIECLKKVENKFHLIEDMRTEDKYIQCGAEYTAEKISEYGKWNELEAILTEQYPDGIDEAELNDILRHEEEMVFKWLGINPEEEEEEEEEFEIFCEKFESCEDCPFYDVNDCVKAFEEMEGRHED